ncbi:MAG: MarR family transcriptional regulator, partial [Microbacterium sp.]|nr:MarR family transcriptional regulator [Microbacterium sp.]
MAESSTDAAPDRVAQIQADWRRERPDVDTSPQGVIGRLHRVGMSLTRRLTEVYARFDLTEPEFDLLATLRRSPGHARAAGDLAAHTMVTTGG